MEDLSRKMVWFENLEKFHDCWRSKGFGCNLGFEAIFKYVRGGVRMVFGVEL